ncbi:MAG: hypothetical protein HY737_07605 [Candidatus Omnitrophica bacterium]|nr:hypothetical protein [Candidatus Omnitrophota bacterium]
MAARIGTSVVTGFRSANRSWLGIGLYAAGWLVIGVISLASLLVTSPPQALFEDADTPAPAVTAQADAQMVEARNTERERIINAWFFRAWPVLLGLAIVYVLATTWLTGGQLGYAAQLVRTPHAHLRDFRAAGSRHFGPLLGALGLGLAVSVIAFAAVIALVMVSAAAGRGVLVALSVAALLVASVALVWLGVRLVFWWIAIVGDGLGPIAALKASFRATRKRWWRTMGLVALLGVINAGASIVCRAIVIFGGVLGGVGGVLLILAGVLPLIIWSLYFTFVFTAASIRFYDDATKSAPSASVA